MEITTPGPTHFAIPFMAFLFLSLHAPGRSEFLQFFECVQLCCLLCLCTCCSLVLEPLLLSCLIPGSPSAEPRLNDSRCLPYPSFLSVLGHPVGSYAHFRHSTTHTALGSSMSVSPPCPPQTGSGSSLGAHPVLYVFSITGLVHKGGTQ